jgi:hypothetical protein
MTSLLLSPTQLHALFDILTHHESYSEIQTLKNPEAIAKFGLPLQPETPSDSSSPLLQVLLKKFITVLPGIRDVPSDFWQSNITGLATALDSANLSESYDKGSIGIRKTLSTAIASIVEYVSRGVLGGYPKTAMKKDGRYDASNPDEVIAAWNEFLQQIIYGDMLEKMVAKAAETDKLTDHEPLVQAAHEYAFVMFEPNQVPSLVIHLVHLLTGRQPWIFPTLHPHHLASRTVDVATIG